MDKLFQGKAIIPLKQNIVMKSLLFLTYVAEVGFVTEPKRSLILYQIIRRAWDGILVFQLSF